MSKNKKLKYLTRLQLDLWQDYPYFSNRPHINISNNYYYNYTIISDNFEYRYK